MLKRKETSIRLLNALMSNQPKSPLNLAVEIDRAPQTVRNTISILKQLKYIENSEYGLYMITDMGRQALKRLTQSSTVQSLGEGEK